MPESTGATGVWNGDAAAAKREAAPEAEIAGRAAAPKLLDQLRADLRAGRHHPRGTVSAELIRRWGFARVMKHMHVIRGIFERVEAEERQRAEERGPKAMRERAHFPGDRRRQVRAAGRGTAGRMIPPPPSFMREGGWR